MANERITEDIVRDHFKNDPLFSTIKLEEQKSKNPRIQKLLQHASKSGKDTGKPEFIIHGFNAPYHNLIVVVECKSDIKDHESKTGDRYSKYAVDGVKLYASYLSERYDVIAIAISGEDVNNMKFSYCYWKNGYEDSNFSFKEDYFYSFQEILNILKPEMIKSISLDKLREFARTLNIDLHKNNVSEDKRVFLMSGVLLALEDPKFLIGYNATDKNGKKSSPIN